MSPRSSKILYDEHLRDDNVNSDSIKEVNKTYLVNDLPTRIASETVQVLPNILPLGVLHWKVLMRKAITNIS